MSGAKEKVSKFLLLRPEFLVVSLLTLGTWGQTTVAFVSSRKLLGFVFGFWVLIIHNATIVSISNIVLTFIGINYSEY